MTSILIAKQIRWLSKFLLLIISYFSKKHKFNTNEMSINELASIFYDESGSATKKTDYIKLSMTTKNSIQVHYGNGLKSKVKGKSPLVRKFKLALSGDTCDDVIPSDSFTEK